MFLMLWVQFVLVWSCFIDLIIAGQIFVLIWWTKNLYEVTSLHTAAPQRSEAGHPWCRILHMIRGPRARDCWPDGGLHIQIDAQTLYCPTIMMNPSPEQSHFLPISLKSDESNLIATRVGSVHYMDWLHCSGFCRKVQMCLNTQMTPVYIALIGSLSTERQ
jgi:hypothetical protein